MVESVQLPLADRLERLIETNHPDEPRLFARALGLLADFRSNQFTLPFNSKSRSVEESRIPGVDGRGGDGWQSRRWYQPIILAIFPENCMKLKNLDLGGARP